MMTKANFAKRALKKLLKAKRKEIQAQGYENEDEMIAELMKVPLEKLQEKQKEMKENE